MGAVYEVVHLETERRRALKIMHPHLFHSDEMRERFKQEARIAAKVASEYIVDVSDAGVDEATQTPLLVMELLVGEELGNRLERLGRFPPEDVVTYMQQVAWALDRTHAASIVHRDLKPENLFLTTREDGSPRIQVLDLGIAKVLAETATGGAATRLMGTELYMAPEQMRAGPRLTGAADIYALTLITYTLLVGTPYWLEEAEAAGGVMAFALIVLEGLKETAVQRAARYRVTLPPGFDAWFARGTALDPAERFPSASEAVRALREINGLVSLPPAPVVAAPTMVSYRNEPIAPGSTPLSTGSALKRASTSTSAAVTPAPLVEPKPRSLVGVGAALAVVLLGAGGWFALRSTSTSPSTSIQSLPTARAAPLAATSAGSVEAAPVIAARLAVPIASASGGAAPMPTTTTLGQKSRPVSGSLSTAHAAAPAPPVAASTKARSLIGRD